MVYSSPCGSMAGDGTGTVEPVFLSTPKGMGCRTGVRVQGQI